MNESTPLSYPDLRRFLLLVVGLYLGWLALKVLAPVVMLFTIVFFLALVLNPAVAWLEVRGCKRPLGTMLVMLGLVGLLVLIGYLVVPPMLKQVDDLVVQAPQYGQKIREHITAFGNAYPALRNVVPGLHAAVQPAHVDLQAKQLLNHYGPEFGHEVLGRTLKVLSGLLFGVLALLLTTFLLARPRPIVTGFLAAVPQRHREAAGRCLARLSQQMLAWIGATLINGLITGTAIGLVMHFLGVKPAFVFGVLAFAGEFVPSVGPVVMNIPALFVAAGTSPKTFVLALVAVIVVQQIESNVLVPFIMGRNLELHPFVIIAFALSMGLMFGPIGAVLAVPAAVLVKIVMDEFYTKPNSVPVDEIGRRVDHLVKQREWPAEPGLKRH